jgi:hypothetical protein
MFDDFGCAHGVNPAHLREADTRLFPAGERRAPTCPNGAKAMFTSRNPHWAEIFSGQII